MQESLPPSRPAVAQSARNMTTAPASDIPRLHDDSANETHVATEESLLPPRLAAARSARKITTAPSDTPRHHDDFANHTHVGTEESLLPPRPIAAQSAKNLTTAPTNDMPPRFANNTHAGTDKSLLPYTHDAAHPPINKTTTATNDVPRLHDDLVGKDVILYAILRSESPVARGTIISTNPNAIVGGQPLGSEYCEVVVNVVMKREAMLPRSYGEMLTMASALNMNIAWPFNKVKECKKREGKKASGTPLKGTAGSAGHKSLP